MCFCVWTLRCIITLAPKIKTLWHIPHLYFLFSVMNHLMLFQVTTLKSKTYHKVHNNRLSQGLLHHHLTIRHLPSYVDQHAVEQNLLILEVLQCSAPGLVRKQLLCLGFKEKRIDGKNFSFVASGVLR